MLKILYAGCLGQSAAISSQFTVEMCAAVKSYAKFIKNPYFRGLRSFEVIDVYKFKNFITYVCYDKQHVYLSATVFILYKPITAK